VDDDAAPRHPPLLTPPAVSGNGERKQKILSKLKRLYYRIRKKTGFPIENLNSIHLEKLNTKNFIEIDGKKYLRINLRFVDTLDSDSTRFLFQLEEEIESLRAENLKTISLNSLLEKKIREVERLNINLHFENRSQTAKLKKEKKVSQEKLNEYKTLTNSAQERLEEKEEIIKDRDIKLQEYQTKFKQKEKEIEFLRNSLSRRKETEDKTEGGKRQVLKKMSELKKEYKNKIALKDNIIKEKELFIKTLSDKLLDNEKKITDLKEYISTMEYEFKQQVEENHYR